MSTINAQPRKVIRTISNAIWDTELIASRMLLSVAEMFWGLMLLWPGAIFYRGIYHNMARIMPEDMWGVMFVVSAILQAGIALSGKLHSKFARCFAAWNAFFWCGTVMCMIVSVYPPPAAVGGEVALAISAFWIWIRPYILAEGYKSVGYN